jgi:hypothetical protein
MLTFDNVFYRLCKSLAIALYFDTKGICIALYFDIRGICSIIHLSTIDNKVSKLYQKYYYYFFKKSYYRKYPLTNFNNTDIFQFKSLI